MRTLVAMRHYPEVTGPARSYVVPALVTLAVVVVLFLVWSWYLQGLEAECRTQCLANGGKNYQYVEPTGIGRRFYRGTCICAS